MKREHHFDVVVVGGGTAGVAAAVSASRSGARVALLERQGYFGGTMTGVSLGSLCGYYVVDDNQDASLVVGSIPLEIAERLRAVGGASPDPVPLLSTMSIPYDIFSLKRVLDELIVESGITVYSHSWVSAALKDGGRVVGVRAHAPSGTFEILADAVIDASGNAVVAADAGVDYELRTDVQSPTAMFRFGGVDVDVASGIDRAELRRVLESAVADGFELPRTAGGMFSVREGIMHLNVTRAPLPRDRDFLDPLALTDMEISGRAQVSLYEKAFQRYVPGFENAFVLDSGTELGIRESRRIVGEYTLTGDDVRRGARFDDGIGCSAWPVESHGVGTSTVWEWLPPGVFYEIPLRTLVPRVVDGIVIAGRTLSAEPAAHASARVAAQCMAMGEATGILAAQSAATGVPMRSVPASTVRDVLHGRGAFLG